MSHIAIVNIVRACRDVGRTFSKMCQRLKLTARLYYRPTDDAAWIHALLIIEGTAPSVDAFIEDLRQAKDAESPLTCSGVSTLLRQWSYTLAEMPAERHTWGYKDWLNEAARELHELGPAPPQELDTVSQLTVQDRVLGPLSFKAAAFEDWDALIATRLEKLGLGCDWGEVVIAAQLACAPAQTTEDGGGGARKRSRVLDEPLRAARAPAFQGDDPELGSVGEQLTELRVAPTRA